jgi:hypothetical protein
MSNHRKIILAGDTHGNKGAIRDLFHHALQEGATAIFQLGDFGFWEHTQSGHQFLEKCAFWSKETGIPLYWIDGNHENHTLLRKNYGPGGSKHILTEDGFWQIRPGIYYVPRGTRWTWNGKRIMGLGGAYSVDKEYRLFSEGVAGRDAYGQRTKSKGPRTLWWPEEEITDEEVDQILSDESPIDILFTHDKPRGSNPRWNRKDFQECFPNQDRISRVIKALKPSLIAHGHLHYRYDDQIRVDGDHWAKVVGLACDMDSDADSWILLTLENEDGDK